MREGKATMSDRRDNYNLLEEAWIPVLWADGKFSRVDIERAPGLLRMRGAHRTSVPNP